MLALIGRWFDLIPTSTTQDMVKILNIGQQGRALSVSCSLPRFRKTNLCTPLCIEMDLGSFMRVVYMGFIFILALV